MNRRNFLIGVGGGVVFLSGCSGGGNEDNEQGEGTTTETTNEATTSNDPSVEDFVEISEHSFELPPAGSGVDLHFTVKNVSDIEITRIRLDGEIYSENERLDTGMDRVYDLPADTKASDSMAFTELERTDDVTHYMIKVNVRPNDDIGEVENEYEYNDFEYPV